MWWNKFSGKIFKPAILSSIFALLGIISPKYGMLAQETYTPLNHELNLRLEKIHYKEELFFSGVKPYDKALANITDSLAEKSYINTRSEFFEALLNKDLLRKSSQDFSLILNPIITSSAEFVSNNSEFYNNHLLGLSIIGNIGKKLGFSLDAFYGIRAYHPFISIEIDSVNSLPYFGKYLSINGQNYHYAPIRGYFSYKPFEFLHFDVGIGNQFWGDGHRSLFLSDNSPAYPYLKTTLELWKIKYVYLLGLLSDRNNDLEGNRMRPKVLVAHLLNYNVNHWLNFSFFEGIISNPTDSLGLTHFNFGYLNPVIFFRPVEFASGSVDNVILGIGCKIKLFKSFQLYGQFLADEFVVSQVFSDKNWWGNKYGFQTGLKVFDFLGIENFFTRLEYNRVRPYTYSYYTSFGNYGNRFQPLAHPMGANFSETLAEFHYHYKRFSVLMRFIFGKAGMDDADISYGQDIYKPNSLRVSDYGIIQGQGMQADFMDIGLTGSWLMNPKMNLSLFVALQYQNYTKSENFIKDLFFSFGIKSLIFNNEKDFFR